MDIEDLGSHSTDNKHLSVRSKVPYASSAWAKIEQPPCTVTIDPQDPSRILLPSESHTLGEWWATILCADPRILSAAYVRSPSSIVVHLVPGGTSSLSTVLDDALTSMITQTQQCDTALRHALSSSSI